MRIMDRYLFFNFLVAYTICFTSLVGLNVIIDLFSNADEFLEDHPGTYVFVRRASKYYFAHSFEYFGRLSPIITMMSGMATLAALHRHNEIVALLAAGIPTRRALVPIFLGTLLMIVLGVLNREIAIPRLSDVLQRFHENIEADKAFAATMYMDKDQILFRAQEAHAEDNRLEMVNVTLPMEIVGQLQEVHASKAYYRADEETGKMGWLLVNPAPRILIHKANDRVKKLKDGNLFIFSNASFTDMIRRVDWMKYASTSDLITYLQSEEIKNPQTVRILIHNRLMQPVLNLLLVLIGIPFVLQWERKNVYFSIAIAMGLGLMFFVVDTSAGYFAEHGYIDPLMAAWVPVFLFGPLAFALFHRVGT